MNRLGIAGEIIKYYDKWERLEKNDLVFWLKKYVSDAYPECKNLLEHGTSRGSSTALIQRIMEMTGSKKDSVFSWLNMGRADVKIPFIKLCKLADALNIELDEFLKKQE